MDEIIFEDPSKHVSRPKKSSRRVVLPEERKASDCLRQTQDREHILQNLQRNNPHTDIIGSVASPGPPYFRCYYSSINLIRL